MSAGDKEALITASHIHGRNSWSLHRRHRDGLLESMDDPATEAAQIEREYEEALDRILTALRLM